MSSSSYPAAADGGDASILRPWKLITVLHSETSIRLRARTNELQKDLESITQPFHVIFVPAPYLPYLNDVTSV